MSPDNALVYDFYRARFRADLEQALARLSGKPVDLLNYEEVRQKLRAQVTPRRVLKDIPIDAIVGSVGRHWDFIRGFLPRQEVDAERWARIKAMAMDMEGLPPIEAYQIGDAYFVLDGNHRVSVARDLGATHIEGYVTEVAARVSLDADADIEEVVRKAAYVEFMERTGLDRLRPEARLEASAPEAYALLERNIDLHRYVMGIEQKRGIAYDEAVTDWYDNVYSRVVAVIREQGSLRDFPGSTEADLYLMVSGYRALTEEVLDWEFEQDDGAGEQEPAAERDIVRDLAGRVLRRQRELGQDVLPGEWRREVMINRQQALATDGFRLFTSLLVPISGQEPRWYALEQALLLARQERGRLLGLHVVPTEAARASDAARSVEAQFRQRCQAEGVLGRLAVVVGEVAPTICQRSLWADMTIVSVSYPPPAQPLARLGSGFRTLLLGCRSPLLAAPAGSPRRMRSALLAYNGSAQADEALFVAAYFARRQGVSLSVISVGEGDEASANLARAETQLREHGVDAWYLAKDGPPAAAVVSIAAERDVDVIVMGGYSRRGVSEVMRGSQVDEVLRAARRPVLVCP